MSDDARAEDRIDALISASLDNALSSEEAAELAALMADDEVSSRAQDFQNVDDALRALAEEPLDDARLEASLGAIQERLLESASEDAAAARIGAAAAGTGGGVIARIRPALYGGMAAAAAAMLFFAAGTGNDGGLTPAEIAGENAAETRLADPALPELTEESLVAALGYLDGPADLSELGLASPEDLEIVEQLELLDFLAAREEEGRG